MTPQMSAALAADAPTLFGAIRIDLPGQVVRLLDGVATLTFDGGTFAGSDPLYGVIDSIEEIGDGFGDEAPAIAVTFLPPDEAAVASLCDPTAQGSKFKMWLGAVDVSAGTVISDPEPLFAGSLDVPTLTIDEGKRELEIAFVSAFERYFENDEGARLSPTFHKDVWPGETGLDNVNGVDNTIYWGVASPQNAVSYGGGGGSANFVRNFEQIIREN